MKNTVHTKVVLYMILGVFVTLSSAIIISSEEKKKEKPLGTRVVYLQVQETPTGLQITEKTPQTDEKTQRPKIAAHFLERLQKNMRRIDKQNTAQHNLLLPVEYCSMLSCWQTKPCNKHT